jgi:hypothetical protein
LLLFVEHACTASGHSQLFEHWHHSFIEKVVAREFKHSRLNNKEKEQEQTNLIFGEKKKL